MHEPQTIIDMKKILLSVIILAAIPVLASNQTITRKGLKYDQTNGYEDRLDAQEKELQNLLGRIEMLEYTVSRIEKSMRIIGQDKTDTQETAVTKSSQEPAHTDDVFDVSLIKDIDNQATPKSNEATKETLQSDKQLYDLALALLKDNKLEDAEEKFAGFLKKYPNSTLLSNAYFWYGETFFKRNMFDKAAINYLKGYKQSPKGAKASDSLLKLALSLGELKKHQEACGILHKLEEEFPTRSATSIKRAKDAIVKFGCKSGK